MYRIIRPYKDATIYENNKVKNTGIDEILEIAKYAKSDKYFDSNGNSMVADNNYNSRILMEFDISEFETLPIDSKFYLKLTATETKALQFQYNLEAFPLTQYWTNGNGNKHDSPEIRNGASWLYSDGNLRKTEWETGSMEYVTVKGGGAWNTNYSSSLEFKYNDADVYMDVTNIVNAWRNKDIENYGLILKFTDEIEANPETYGMIQYFSRESHTIYLPSLQAYYDDNNIYSGSFNDNEEINENYVLYITNIKSEYQNNEKHKLRVKVRDLYPSKDYKSQKMQINDFKLPDATYFSIVDYITKEPIVHFDDIGTKVKTDDYGHYINLNIENFPPVRYYQILFKIEKDGIYNIWDGEDFIFKVKK